MSQIRVQFDDVATAAESLEQAGENPTIEKIRDHLGKRGSYSTISRHLKDWREERINQSTDKNPTTDKIQEAVKSVWDSLNQETQQTIESIKAEASEKIEAAETQSNELAAQLVALKKDHETLQNHYHEQSAQKELLALDHKQLQETHTLLEERYQSLDSRYKEMKAYNDAQIRQLQESNQAEIARLSECNKREIEAAKQLASTLKDHYEEARTESMVSQDKLKVENQKLYDHIKKLEADKAVLTKEGALQTASLEKAYQQLAKAEGLISKQQAQWDEIKNKKFISDGIISSLEALPKELGSNLSTHLKSHLKSAIDQVIRQVTPTKKKKAKTNA